MYANILHQYNPQMPEWQSKDLARHLILTAARWKIDTNMLAAIVTVESSWHTHAVSYAGAIGLGQLMPGTAATLGVNPRDPAENLQGAARYLRGLLERFGSNRIATRSSLRRTTPDHKPCSATAACRRTPKRSTT